MNPAPPLWILRVSGKTFEIFTPLDQKNLNRNQGYIRFSLVVQQGSFSAELYYFSYSLRDAKTSLCISVKF